MIIRFLLKWFPLVAPAVLGWSAFFFTLWRNFMLAKQLRIAKEQLGVTNEQLTTAKAQLSLNVRRATPNIGTRMRLVRSVEPLQVVRYTIHTTIYNDGDLVATKIKGQWKLTISHLMQDANKPIIIDSLPASRPWDMEHQIGGNTNWIDTHQVSIKVDIDLVYLGLDNKENSYHATYNYTPVQKDMIRADERHDGQ